METVLSFTPYASVFLAICTAALLLSLKNIRTIQRNTPRGASRQPAEEQKRVSVMIPVRNEERHLAACLDSLLKQTYDNYEILVYDDQSNDRSWEIMQRCAEQHKYIHIYKGGPLPAGWNGKHHALHHLSRQAQGDIFLFTDADTIHSPDSIALGLSSLQKNGVSMVSGFPRQLLPDRLTQIIVSLMHFQMLFILPLWLQKKYRSPYFALAIGQYICMTREAYEGAGGYEAVKTTVSDDIHIARKLMKHGYAQCIIDIRTSVSCTMYSRPRDAFWGISRNVMDFFDNSLLLPLLLAPLLLLFIVLPPLTVLYALIAQGVFLLIPAAGTLLLYAAWTRILLFFGYPFRLSGYFLLTLLLPVIMVAVSSVLIRTKRGFIWKDRTVL